MAEQTSLGVAVAFLAGLLSFLSPCVLPLVPSYVGFLTGLTLDEMPGRRRTALIHAVLFVAGFTRPRCASLRRRRWTAAPESRWRRRAGSTAARLAVPAAWPMPAGCDRW